MLARFWRKWNYSCTAIGNIKCYSHFGNKHVSCKTNHVLTIQLSNYIHVHLSQGDEDLWPHKNLNTYLFIEAKKVGITQMFFNKWIIKLTVFAYHGILLSNKKERQYTSQLKRIWKELCRVKKYNIKYNIKYHTVWLYLCNILEETKLESWKTD